MRHLKLKVLPGHYAICRFNADTGIKERVRNLPFYAVVRTQRSLTLVCDQNTVGEAEECEKNWRCLEIEGFFDFSETGILSQVCGSLANAGIAVFVISAFETDYLLIKNSRFNEALEALRASGHQISSSGAS
jgi:hypothetical protein